MFELESLKIALQNDALLIYPAVFPAENGAKKWAEQFLQQFEITISESETSADQNQYCFTVKEHVYVLTISFLIQSIWINDMASHDPHIEGLYHAFKNKTL